LRRRATEADAKLKRLYDAIENGVTDLSDLVLKDRITELKAIRDQARADIERAEGAIDRADPDACNRSSEEAWRNPFPGATPPPGATQGISTTDHPSSGFPER
jgi:hypothetical protein